MSPNSAISAGGVAVERRNLKDSLLGIPLFTGMSTGELQDALAETKIEFLRYVEGQVVVRQGEKCGRLLLLISGDVTCHSTAADGSYAVTERFSAPLALQVDGLFGMFQMFTHTVTAVTPVSMISIGKSELLRLAGRYVIFRINLVNSLSTALQKKSIDQWRGAPETLAGRIIAFLRRHCLVPSGPKTFHIKMTTLAREVNDNRLYVSRALNTLQRQGLITLLRGRIEIPAMQDLFLQ